jgi:wyosine [tRNA(Phe)-imidazoG37] synthetase (radical SAM superfamily)/predicted Fe-Mo cluster-binding NifX family protein
VSPGATRYVFGPVPSRRLGRSLGVDLVPFKTCTYDCVYCQLGHTTFKTAQRRAWVPVHKVLAEVRAALGSEPEWITLAGSGEPTLHCGLGAVIKGIKQLTSTPVAVLTNGSLFWQPQVRDDLAAADLVMPSLDAPDAALFRRVNRPHHAIGFGRMVDGLGRFRRKFRGLYWLEVFLLDGVTSSDADVERLAALADGIAPDLVQLNTVARPPAEPTAAGVPAQTLERLAGRARWSRSRPAWGSARSTRCTEWRLSWPPASSNASGTKGACSWRRPRPARSGRSEMKVAISARGNDIDSFVDPRFGRARWFVVADTENGEWRAHDNAENVDAGHGAGIQAASNVVRLGVAAVITGDVGPNAFRVLTEAGVRAYASGQTTVRDALEALRAGALREVTGATVPGRA